MKCPSCGYAKETQTQVVDEVVRFKSGKRKGEIKEVKEKTIEFKVGDNDFEEFEILTGVRDSCNNYYNSYDTRVSPSASLDFASVTVNCCPECGTIFKKDYWR